MRYKVTVEELTPTEPGKYPIKETIYEQTVDILNLQAVIKAVNPEERSWNADEARKQLGKV